MALFKEGMCQEGWKKGKESSTWKTKWHVFFSLFTTYKDLLHFISELLDSRPQGRSFQPVHYRMLSSTPGLNPLDACRTSSLFPTKWWQLNVTRYCHMFLGDCNPIENNCPKGKKFPQRGASLNKKKWKSGVVTIGHGEGSGLGLYYKEAAKKGRLSKTFWLEQNLLLKGFANTGQPPFRHINDAGVGLGRETLTLPLDCLGWVARNWERAKDRSLPKSAFCVHLKAELN